MPIYKRKRNGKQYYYGLISYTDTFGNYQQKSTKYFTSKEEAVNAEVALRIELKHSEKYSLTFDEAFEEYKIHQKEKVKEQTWVKYDSIYAHIKPTLGKVNIAKLNVKQYQAFKSFVPKEFSLRHKNRIHKLVKSIIKFADTMYGISSNVPDRVGGFVDPNQPKKEMQFYTEEEFLQFIAVLEGDVIYRTLFKVLYYEGLRIGEADALTWNEIDFEKKTISVKHTVNNKIAGKQYILSTPKTKGSNRVIPISNKVIEDLKELHSWWAKMDHFDDSWFVFGGLRPLPDTTITKKKDDTIEKAGTKRIRIHDFRHSCASYYIHKGAQPILLSRLLGHSSISITMDTYSHLYPDDLEKMMNENS